MVDINNNPDNPVINDRSFGQDKYRVAQLGIQYMRGLQDEGVMACAKHFPGHGDVSVDSHLDLPVINKSRKELDSGELYPFRQLFAAGVGSVMIGHLSVPAIDNTPDQPTSLSNKTVSKLLRKQLKFGGISFTDALEMKGVSKYFPSGSASVQSLIAGNDMLCLPADIPGSIQLIRAAIDHHQLKWKDIDGRVKKILAAKYQYGLSHLQPINTEHLTEDLNAMSKDMRRRVAESAITLLKNEDTTIFPLRAAPKKRIAYIGFGVTAENEFARRMRTDYKAHVYFFEYSLDSTKAIAILDLLKNRYDAIVIGLHSYNRFPANDFGISNAALWLIRQLQSQTKTAALVFGNPYSIRQFCYSKTLVACYEDDDITQGVAADLLNGKFPAKGRLPVTVCDSFPYGSGIITSYRAIPTLPPSREGVSAVKLRVIDSICLDAINRQATPGCMVLVAKDGAIIYEKAFGYLTYDKTEPVYPETIYDLASVTKICATTMAVMKLYEEGRLDLQKTLGDYLPWTRGTNKASLKIWDVLLHQAGLKAFIPFYQENHQQEQGGHSFADRVCVETRLNIPDTRSRKFIHAEPVARHHVQPHLQSDLGAAGRYIYSDNDFIFMGKIVESLTGMTLDEYVKKTFYDPLGMTTTGFKPRERFALNRIAPTEQEAAFRKQLLRGDVHDPGAAMFGGVAGHAGLFSDAYDLAILEQMLLNGGSFNGQQYLKKETIDFFTAYHSDSSRRGLGFDKPEKDNLTRKEPYPCLSASPRTFGHTGYTGTCVWVDPDTKLVFIFLSNRVNPSGGENLKLSNLSVRGNIMEAIYKAMDTFHAP